MQEIHKNNAISIVNFEHVIAEWEVISEKH